MSIRTITPRELHTVMAGGPPDLVDVRSPGEYASVHAQGARSIPLGQVSAKAVQESRPAEVTGPTYVICHSGGRSRQVCALLAREGLDVVNVEGGTSAWEASGLPVVRSEASGEAACGPSRGGVARVVRRIGLVLVLLCLLLGVMFQPWFFYVAFGIWVVLIVSGGGACPLGSCGTR